VSRAFICGLLGASLTTAEQDFLRDAQPWGVILFKRNVKSRAQLQALTEEIRSALGRSDAPVVVDQEGGRVQRLASPHWRDYPAAARFALVTDDPARQERLAWLGARLIAHDLREVGITIDCLPVLDAPQPGAHDVIGDRAYSRDPASVAQLGRAAALGLLAGGVLPVMKHIPGHGRARADSHKELPVVEASREELERVDFPPFRANADLPCAMTAHVVYTAIDPHAPGTLSKTVVSDIIRGRIGFDGLLMTDDLSMHALTGTFRSRAEAAIEAGCDIVLHCNGDAAESRAVAEGAPELSGRALERAQGALGLIANGAEFDRDAAIAEFDDGLTRVG
jgi:beta-N-acetylhexosaminidase